MAKFNQISDSEIKLIKEIFLETMRLADNLLGKLAFRKPKINTINKPLLEAWALNIYHLNQQQIDQLQKQKNEFFEHLFSLQEQGTFNDKIYKTLGNSDFFQQRFIHIQTIINQFLQ